MGSCMNCKSYTFRRFVPFQYLLCKCVSFKITEDNLVELFNVIDLTSKISVETE